MGNCRCLSSMKVINTLLALCCALLMSQSATAALSSNSTDLYQQAGALYLKQDFAEAEKLLRSALQESQQSADATPAMKAQLLNDLSLVLFKQGKRGEAKSLLEKANQLASSSKDNRLSTAILTNTSIIKKREKDYTGALSLANQALNLASDKQDQIEILDLIAEIYRQQKNFKAAHEARSKLVVMLAGSTTEEVSDNLLWLADLEKEMNNTKAAEQHLIESVSLGEKNLGKNSDRVRGYVLHLAQFYETIGKYSASENIFKTIADNDKNATDYLIRGRLLLAGFYERRSRNQDATKVYEKAASDVTSSQLLNESKKAKQLESLADSARIAKNYAIANAIYAQAIPIFQKEYDKNYNSREGKEPFDLSIILGHYASSVEASGNAPLAAQLRAKSESISTRRRNYAYSIGAPDWPEGPKIKFYSMEEPGHQGIFLQ
jgi:hypothetical protein